MIYKAFAVLDGSYKLVVQKYIAHIASSPNFFSVASTSCSFDSCDTEQSNARFFLRPIFVPSGVSIGHNLPRWVLCNARASKFSWLALNGETIRCKCDIDAVKFALSILCEIPFLPPTHVPVAMDE